jgi:hypothetical protein
LTLTQLAFNGNQAAAAPLFAEIAAVLVIDLKPMKAPDMPAIMGSRDRRQQRTQVASLV